MKTAPRIFSLTAMVFVSCVSLAQKTENIISDYLKTNADTWGLTANDVKNIEIASTASSLAPGTKHYYINQVYQGYPVVNGVASVVIKDNKVLRVASKLLPITGLNMNTVGLTSEQAISRACENLAIPYVATGLISEDKEKSLFTYEGGTLAYEEIPVRLVVRADGDQLNFVWDLSIHPKGTSDWWSMQVSASSGEILFKNNWTLYCNHTHSETCSIETAQKVCMPQPPPGADQYLCYAYPTESPNHGQPQVLTNPSDPTFSPFGWHDTNGVLGDEYTYTRGNNVYASEDINDDNNPGYSPDGGPGLNFVFPYDSTYGPLGNMDAIITNLFCANNSIHDILAYYGFDEESGNFQENNYSGDGNDSDGVNADAVDGSGTDNANFSTPPDGSNPRMQMYLWNVDGSSAHLIVHSPDSISGNYASSPATFGPEIQFNEPVIGDLVLVVDDGVDTTDACDNIVNGAALNGKIALVRRGNCNYVEKALTCQDLGAIAVVFINTQNSIPSSIGGTTPANNPVLIPSCVIGKADGDSIIESLIAGATVNVELWSSGDIDALDSDMDNGVIAHEFGHGVSNRLIGGPNNTNCMFNDEQLGEGWSDFFALILTMKSDMDVERTRGMGTYVNGEPTTGVGIRPTRYSTNPSFNGATLATSNTLTAVHGRGYVWNSMLWELTWALIDEYGFDPDIKEGTGGNNMALALVVEGLKLTPCNSGFTAARDAILDADELLYGGANQCLIWRAFAKRGLGFSADSGDEDDAGDQSEAFNLPTTCTLGLDDNEIKELVVYPNPGTSQVTVDLSGCDNASTISIVDITGKKIVAQQVSTTANAITIDVSGLSKGMYIIQVIDDKGLHTREWMKN